MEENTLNDLKLHRTGSKDRASSSSRIQIFLEDGLPITLDLRCFARVRLFTYFEIFISHMDERIVFEFSHRFCYMTCSQNFCSKNCRAVALHSRPGFLTQLCAQPTNLMQCDNPLIRSYKPKVQIRQIDRQIDRQTDRQTDRCKGSFAT